MEISGKVQITITVFHNTPFFNLFHSFDDGSNKEINRMIFRNIQAVSKDYDVSLIKRKIQFN